MNLVAACINNPVKVAVGVLLVALFGGISLWRMPMQLTPEVQVPTLSVTTRWPGASPQDIEREIVQEQEEQLKSVEGLKKMTSECQDSQGVVKLEFAVGANMEEALLKVNSRLSQVREYPEDASEPVISTSSASDRPIAWFVLTERLPPDAEIEAFAAKHPELAEPLAAIRKAHSPGLKLYRLRDLVNTHPQLAPLVPADIDVPKLRRFVEDNIEARFERVKGVSDANVMGGETPELQVVIDPARLAARGLTINQVRNVLRSENQDTSGGDIREDKRRYVVRTLGQYRSEQQVLDQILTVDDGKPVYVRDVAEARLGAKKPDSFVRRFGDSCIAVNAQRETGANVLEVMRGLQEETERLNDTVLKKRGLILSQVYDETDYIHSAIGLVNGNIWVGGLLTVLTLLVFLQSGRSTLVIAVAIPTSLIGTFLILHLLGRSLNVISLAGLAFAVGMLVDNAVVVLENIYRHYQGGAPPFVAAERATREVYGAVAASTFTTLAVFLPVLFIEEEAGQLFRDIALAISAAVGLSMIAAIMVAPPAAARLLRRLSPEEIERGPQGWLPTLLTPVTRLGELFVAICAQINDWILRGAARRAVTVGALFVGAVVLSWLFWPKVEYLPNGNRNLVISLVMPPTGYNVEEMMAIGSDVERELRPFWDFDPGDPALAKLPFPPVDDFFYVARNRQLFLGLRCHEPSRAAQLIPLIYSKFGSAVPGSIVVAFQSSLFESGLQAGRTIDVEITGPELDRLIEIGGQVMGQVMGGPGQEAVIPGGRARPQPSLDKSSPELHVRAKPMGASEMGFTNTELGYAVNALVDGAYVADYFHEGDKIDLVLLGNERFVRHTQDLAGLPVATPSGHLAPLAALADIELGTGPEQLLRRERQLAITIQVTPPDTMALEDALNRIDQQIVRPLRESGRLDAGYQITLSGAADKLRQTWNSLNFNVVLAGLITYLLMAALFESWVHPLVIIMSVPLGAVGGVLGLWMLNVYLYLLGEPPQSLDVLTMLGFVILIGTVVNNPILIVHQALQHIELDGMSSRQAVVESVRTRVRPIFMTTTTTVLGLAPLVFFPGAGSELYRGLGAVVLGGLAVSTVFTLFLIPSMFTLSHDCVTWLVRALWGENYANQRERLPPDATERATPGHWTPRPRGELASAGAAESNGAHDGARDDTRLATPVHAAAALARDARDHDENGAPGPTWARPDADLLDGDTAR